MIRLACIDSLEIFLGKIGKFNIQILNVDTEKCLSVSEVLVEKDALWDWPVDKLFTQRWFRLELFPYPDT